MLRGSERDFEVCAVRLCALELVSVLRLRPFKVPLSFACAVQVRIERRQPLLKLPYSGFRCCAACFELFNQRLLFLRNTSRCCKLCGWNSTKN